MFWSCGPKALKLATEPEEIKKIKENELVLKENELVLKEKDNVLKEKDNVLKEKDNALKEQYEVARALVIRFYVIYKETPETISILTKLPLSEVNAIIKAHDEAVDNG